MKKYQNENKKYYRKYFVMGIFLLLALISGGTIARYTHIRSSEKAQILASEFYFTTDKIGDSVMNTEKEKNEYNFLDTEEGCWDLYGGGAHEIQILVRNYYDDLRVTDYSISYKANVKVIDKEGNEISNNIAQINEITGTVNGELKGSDISAKAENTLTLKITAHADKAYEDGTKVIVTIESVEPYSKVINLNYTLYSTDNYLSYEIVDAPNSPYAELIIKNGLNTAATPTIQWPTSLEIDNTDYLTFKTDGDQLQPMNGIGNRKMEVSTPLNVNQSESIYFFKKDASMDYTMAISQVTVSEDTYFIEIKEPTAQ